MQQILHGSHDHARRLERPGRRTDGETRREEADQTDTKEEVDGKPVIKQREIGEDDVCPICQDELLAKRLPVTYCK